MLIPAPPLRTRHVALVACSISTCIAVFTTLLLPRGATADSASDVRAALESAFSSAPVIHRAWAVVSQDSEQELMQIEMFRMDSLYGMSVRVAEGSDAGAREVTTMTDGEVIVSDNADASIPPLPGSARLTRRLAAWQMASDLVAQLTDTHRVPRLGSWVTSFSLQLDDRESELVFRLEAACGKPEAAWLAADQFVGRTIAIEAESIVVRSEDRRVVLRRSDGTPKSIERIEHGRPGKMSLQPREPSRSAEQWQHLIRKRCAEESESVSPSWEYTSQVVDFCRSLQSLVGANPRVLANARGLRIMCSVLSTTLLSLEGLDDSWRSLASEVGNDQGVKQAAEAYWAPLWEAVDKALSQVPVPPETVETTRVALWSELWASVQSAVAKSPNERR